MKFQYIWFVCQAQTLSTFRDCGLVCSNFLFAWVSVTLLEKFARKGRRNFTRMSLTSAVVWDTLSFLSHLNRGFLMTDGSTAHVNFCSGCGRLISKGAACEAAYSSMLTNSTNAMLGYDSPPLSMHACNYGSCRRVRLLRFKLCDTFFTHYVVLNCSN